SNTPEIINRVLEHGNPLDAHTNSKTRVRFGINITIFQYQRIHHTGAADLHPAAAFTDITALTATELAGNINLCTGFGEGKIRRPEPNFGIFPEHLLGKVVKGLFKVSKADVSIYI